MATLALDIGGANLKAAHSSGACQVAGYALWRQPDDLTAQLTALACRFPPFERLAVTMTADLCDCFERKRDGVDHVLAAVEALAAGRPIAVWLTDGRFVDPTTARSLPQRCAAGNWHALATWLAGLYPQGTSLLLDTGSTTTDIVKLVDGQVEATGLTDTQRLASGELIYLGATRTPLAALGPTIDLHGTTYPLMAEYFATTADVYLLTGDLPEQPDRTDTADGRPMTRRGAAARVVRMIGADLDALSVADAMALAGAFAAVVVRRLGGAIGQVLGVVVPQRVILSGSGAVVADAAARAALSGVACEYLSERIRGAAADAACAYALLQLQGSPRDTTDNDRRRVHVVKLGGSLLDLPDLTDRLRAFLEAYGGERLALVVGGGARADTVRRLDQQQHLGEEAAHWLALEALEENARQVAAAMPRSRLVRDPAGSAAAWAAGDVAVIEPLAWLQREHAAGKTIPHRWTFTSDSVTAHLAAQLGALRLTLLKSALPDSPGSVVEAIEQGIVDPDFARASAKVPRIELVNLRAVPPATCALR